ncbi:putative pyruvate formate lyase activating enzyme [Eubacterium ruminantium]|nr:putative pyruvate formate lyase activating enzyme [Eubacterium ruminantium]
MYEECLLCPRDCGVNRNLHKGYCLVGSDIMVSRAALHMWEEPVISGKEGSGTVFFSGCNMGCVFCQNRAISRGEAGRTISPERLVEIFFELGEMGANNINLVTADHFIPSVSGAIVRAKNEGFKLPFLLNTSSYIKVDTLKSLEGLIDIYLPDMKYIRNEDSLKYSHAPYYVETAKAAIDEMIRQQPECHFNDKNIIQKGVVVRHLLMPGMLIQAKMIVKYLHERYGESIYISLMNQYTPDKERLQEEYPEICRKVTEYEYKSLIDYAADIGVVNGFMQVGETAEESFIPEFDLTGV